MPVFTAVREFSHRSTCQSNLKQLGAAFQMYGNDYDGLFPNPGGREIVGAPDNGAAWYSATRNPVTGVVTDSGAGIFPYVKQRGNGRNNVWACLNSLPGIGGRVYDVGQNYAMNDYLRNTHPGEFVTIRGSVPRYLFPSFQTGIDPGLMESSASDVILLFEVVQSAAGGCNRDGSPYFSTPELWGVGSRYGANGLPISAPEEYHNGVSVFLFCDGHVKPMKPTKTWTPDTQWAVERFNRPYARNRAGVVHVGEGTRDLWNPQVGTVTYP